MSVIGKKWIIQNEDPQKNTIEKLLANRGVEDLESLNSLDDFHDPFLFVDMEKTIARIEKALKNQERIMIFGDYDVDGITSTAILFHILHYLGANVSCRIPHRLHDGYGLSEKYIDAFIQKEIKLIITVDCGIACNKEIAKAKEHGIDTIITDHHSIPAEIPDAVAILHPLLENSGYPCRDLTGAGVAFKLAQALIEKYIPQQQKSYFLESLLEFASLGTVADLGVLRGENRLIVKKGLKQISKSRWHGIRKLKKIASIDRNSQITTTHLGFQLSPRINAAGRIGDPYIPLKLLLQQKDSAKLDLLGQELEKLNFQRREMTYKILDEIEIQYQNSAKENYIFFHSSPKWHIGVLGLVAGRLAEKYSRPAIIMQEMDNKIVGSARSPEFFNIIKALRHCEEHLLNCGGHLQAAGFTVEKSKFPAFQKALTAYAKENLRNQEMKPSIEIDCELPFSEVDMNFYQSLENLEPFGVGNQKPIFLLKKVKPMFIELVGREKNHLKFSIENINVIGFSMGEFYTKIKKYSQIDLLCHLNKNVWNNRENLQFQALDFRRAQE